MRQREAKSISEGDITLCKSTATFTNYKKNKFLTGDNQKGYTKTPIYYDGGK